VSGSIPSGCLGCIAQSIEVALQAGDDASVSSDFAVPAAGLGVLAERGVGELGLELWEEFRAGGEVVALFADVGVGTRVGGQVPGAVAVRDAGLEHFGV
jgi:hypothetical protein